MIISVVLEGQQVGTRFFDASKTYCFYALDKL